MTAPVTIYMLRGCRHCIRAKRLLRRKGAAYDEIPTLARRSARRAELTERFGRRTFPQIVIGDRHVGGMADLAALERSGELDRLL